MDERAPAYAFDPLERRGLLFGLRPAQIAVSGGGLVVAWMALRAIAAPIGPTLALLVATAGAVAAFCSKDGESAMSWGRLGVTWIARRLTGPVLAADPLDGERVLKGGATARTNSVSAGLTRAVEVVELPAQPGQAPLGVVVDRRSGLWACTIPARGAAFSLLDARDQAVRLDAWRVVLNSLGRPGTPIRRLQWIERTSPAAVVGHTEATWAPPHPDRRAGRALESYVEVATSADSGSHVHEVWLVVAVQGPHSISGAGGREAAETIRRESRLLEGQLRHADLWTPGPLDGTALAGVLRTAHAEACARSVWARFAPMAEEEGWAAHRTDGAWHATYWIAEWPRIDVGPDFMSPLLMSGTRRAVSLVMEPVPAQRAAREVRSALTSDAAEEQLRARAGFTPSARRGKEAEAAMRREEELADGHAEFRFSGYVTVSAGDRAALDLACAETEHAAQAAHLDVRRLYGRQREAFTWTLPLARGLR